MKKLSGNEIRTLAEDLVKGLDALAAGVAADAFDVVGQLLADYSLAVEDANKRLALCKGLVERGLVSEAWARACEEPALVDTKDWQSPQELEGSTKFLNLESRPGWDQWKAALVHAGIPLPTMPDSAAAAEIANAIGDFQRFEKYHARFRRAVLRNDLLGARLELVRKLRQADGNNPAWVAMQRDHERQLLMDLEPEIKDAYRKQDEETLEKIARQLRGEWLEQPAPRVVGAVDQSLKRLRGARITRELVSIADDLSEARTNGDLATAEKLSDRWQELVKAKGSFPGDSPEVAKAIPVIEWVSQRVEFAGLLVDLSCEIDQRPRTRREQRSWMVELRQGRNRLDDLAMTLGQEVDQREVDQVCERIDQLGAEFDAAERRRSLLTVASVVATLGIVVAIVFSIDAARRFGNAVADAHAQLAELKQRVENGEIDELSESMPGLSPSIRDEPSVAKAFEDVVGTLEKEKGRRDQFQATIRHVRKRLDELTNVQFNMPFGDWPLPLAEAARELVVDATPLARTDDERVLLVQIDGAIKEYINRFQHVTDEACARAVNEIETEVQAAIAAARDKPKAASEVLATAKAELDKLERDGRKLVMTSTAAPYSGTTAASEDALIELESKSKIRAALNRLREKLQTHEQFLRAWKELERVLGDWPEYAKQLSIIATEFKTIPEAEECADVDAARPIWQSIDAWNTFVSKLGSVATTSPPEAAAILGQLDSLPDAEKKLQTFKQFTSQFLPLLQSLAARNVNEMHRELKTEWSEGPWVAELAWQVSIKDGNKVIIAYRERGPKPRREGDFIEYVTGLKAAGWPSTRTFLRQAAVLTVTESPQMKLRNALREAMIKLPNRATGLEVDEILLNCMKITSEFEDLEPCLKLLTVRKFFLFGRGNSTFKSICFDTPAAAIFNANITDESGEIPGLTTDELGSFVSPGRNSNPVYQQTRVRCLSLLEDAGKVIDSGFERLKVLRKQLAAFDKRPIEVVGVLTRGEDGELSINFRESPASPSEIIVVNVDGTLSRVGVFKDGKAELTALKGLLAGMPCFSRKLP